MFANKSSLSPLITCDLVVSFDSNLDTVATRDPLELSQVWQHCLVFLTHAPPGHLLINCRRISGEPQDSIHHSFLPFPRYSDLLTFVIKGYLTKNFQALHFSVGVSLSSSSSNIFYVGRDIIGRNSVDRFIARFYSNKFLFLRDRATYS